MTDAPPPNQLSRGELYRRIWETPLIRVAAEVGVTNFLLASLCKRQDIPTPTAGYWSKIAHGKPTNRPPLPGDPDQPLIVSGLQKPGFRPSKPISRVERRAKSAAVTHADRPLAPIPPHPRLNKTFSRLRTQKDDGFRRVTGPGCFTIVVSAGTLDRAERALSLLVAQVEQKGWSVQAGEKRLEFVVDGETIGCEVTELTDRVPHTPTEKELAAKAAYAARLEAAKRTGAYVSTWDAPKIADWDRVPNGKLSLTLDEAVGYAGIRRTFSDRKTQQVETLIDCVTDAFTGYAVAVKAQRTERERHKVIAEEQQRQREALQRRQELETKRVEFLDRLLARAERISAIRSFQTRLPQYTTLASVAQFSGWISDYVARLEAELSAEHVAEKIALTDLMNDDAVIASWIDVETGGYRRN